MMPDPGYRRDENRTCPECGDWVLVGDWWDDPPEDGGAIIGTRLRCESCEWGEDL